MFLINYDVIVHNNAGGTMFECYVGDNPLYKEICTELRKKALMETTYEWFINLIMNTTK